MSPNLVLPPLNESYTINKIMEELPPTVDEKFFDVEKDVKN